MVVGVSTDSAYWVMTSRLGPAARAQSDLLVANARIQTAPSRIATQAAQWLAWVAVAAIVVLGLVRSSSDAAGWWPIGVGGAVLSVAAAIAVKTQRLPRIPDTREECSTI